MRTKIAQRVATLAMLFLLPVSALAATNTHIRVTVNGMRQGTFRAEAAHGGAGEIPVLRYQYLVTIPRDNTSGLPTGRRQHSPVVITKEIGASTPQFFTACTTNEDLKSVVIEFLKAGPDGKERVYETVRLTNATITRIYQYSNISPSAGQPPENYDLEDISFTFQKIEIENNDGKTVASDDWNAGR